MGEKVRLKVGDVAPDFTLPAVGDQKITLSDYQGKQNVVLAFHPLAWTSV
jgi:peroxiredoxin